jgi:hypothetical protein
MPPKNISKIPFNSRFSACFSLSRLCFKPVRMAWICCYCARRMTESEFLRPQGRRWNRSAPRFSPLAGSSFAWAPPGLMRRSDDVGLRVARQNAYVQWAREQARHKSPSVLPFFFPCLEYISMLKGDTEDTKPLGALWL